MLLGLETTGNERRTGKLLGIRITRRQAKMQLERRLADAATLVDERYGHRSCLSVRRVSWIGWKRGESAPFV